MLLVSVTTPTPELGRVDVDQEARNLVCQTYRNAKSSPANPQARFDQTLDAYQRNYPHIGRGVARHAVAVILSMDGL